MNVEMNRNAGVCAHGNQVDVVQSRSPVLELKDQVRQTLKKIFLVLPRERDKTSSHFNVKLTFISSV